MKVWSWWSLLAGLFVQSFTEVFPLTTPVLQPWNHEIHPLPPILPSEYIVKVVERCYESKEELTWIHQGRVSRQFHASFYTSIATSTSEETFPLLHYNQYDIHNHVLTQYEVVIPSLTCLKIDSSSVSSSSSLAVLWSLDDLLTSWQSFTTQSHTYLYYYQHIDGNDDDDLTVFVMVSKEEVLEFIVNDKTKELLEIRQYLLEATTSSSDTLLKNIDNNVQKEKEIEKMWYAGMKLSRRLRYEYVKRFDDASSSLDWKKDQFTLPSSCLQPPQPSSNNKHALRTLQQDMPTYQPTLSPTKACQQDAITMGGILIVAILPTAIFSVIIALYFLTYYMPKSEVAAEIAQAQDEARRSSNQSFTYPQLRSSTSYNVRTSSSYNATTSRTSVSNPISNTSNPSGLMAIIEEGDGDL